MHQPDPVALIRAVAMLAGIAFVANPSTASDATETNTPIAPRTTAIAWADCNYGFEAPPIRALAAYALTSDGIVVRSMGGRFENEAESAVIGSERFRAIAEEIDRSTLFDPPPTPSPGEPRPIGRSVSDTRNTRFAVRRDGEWREWNVYYRRYTEPEKAAVEAAYAAAYDANLVWHPAPRRADAFAVCTPGASRDAMTIPVAP